MTATTPTDSRPTAAHPRSLSRKHVLMLALALEVLWLGYHGAGRYQPPGIAVDWPATEGHRIV